MSTIPQYRKLYEILRRHISDGLYPEGSLLPSENELCTLHRVTRPTVRHALSKLVNEGYIHKHQGKGSIVRTLPEGIGILSIEGTTSSIGENKLETRILVEPEIRNWPEPFFFELDRNEKESGCIYLERLRIVDGIPIMFDINYIPNINLPRFTSRQFANRSLFAMFRQQYNLEVTGGEQRIWSMRAAENIAEHLKMNTGDPVLHMQRRLLTNRAGFRFYSSLYCTTDRYYLFGSF